MDFKREVLAEFETTYQKRGKHRRKCYVCGSLISDGEQVVAEKSRSEKYYPVKGLMGFINWHFRHVGCQVSLEVKR